MNFMGVALCGGITAVIGRDLTLCLSLLFSIRAIMEAADDETVYSRLTDDVFKNSQVVKRDVKTVINCACQGKGPYSNIGNTFLKELYRKSSDHNHNPMALNAASKILGSPNWCECASVKWGAFIEKKPVPISAYDKVWGEGSKNLDTVDKFCFAMNAENNRCKLLPIKENVNKKEDKKENETKPAKEEKSEEKINKNENKNEIDNNDICAEENSDSNSSIGDVDNNTVAGVKLPVISLVYSPIRAPVDRTWFDWCVDCGAKPLESFLESVVGIRFGVYDKTMVFIDQHEIVCHNLLNERRTHTHEYQRWVREYFKRYGYESYTLHPVYVDILQMLIKNKVRTVLSDKSYSIFADKILEMYHDLYKTDDAVLQVVYNTAFTAIAHLQLFNMQNDLMGYVKRDIPDKIFKPS